LKQYLLPYKTSLKNHNSNKSIDNTGGPRLVKIEGSNRKKKNMRGKTKKIKKFRVKF
jgi:hypothetical protein